MTRTDGTTYTAWDVSKVQDFSYMFGGAGMNSATYSIGNIGNWNTSSGVQFGYVLQGYGGTNTSATSLTLNWNTSNAVDMTFAFSYTKYLQILNISTFDTSNVTKMDQMFFYNQSLRTIYVGSGWNTANVTSSTQMFYASTLLPNYNSSVVDKTNAHSNTGGYFSVRSHSGGVA